MADITTTVFPAIKVSGYYRKYLVDLTLFIASEFYGHCRFFLYGSSEYFKDVGKIIPAT